MAGWTSDGLPAFCVVVVVVVVVFIVRSVRFKVQTLGLANLEAISTMSYIATRAIRI